MVVLTTIQNGAFRNCKKVSFTTLGTNFTSIGFSANQTRAMGYTTSIPYLHFEYDGVVSKGESYARTHTYSNFYGTTYKIYVGNGDQTHDEALLAQYNAASGWTGYSSYLDTWYNYLQANPQ